MALIKCPECNQDVSDKADICIHCGYPLNMDFNNKITSNYYKIQLFNLKTHDIQLWAIKNTVDITRLAIPDARRLIENNYEPIIIEGLDNDDANRVKEMFAKYSIDAEIKPDRDSMQRTILSMSNDSRLRAGNYHIPKQDDNDFIFCPKCRSKLIETVTVSIASGFVEPRNVCKKCGYEWKLKKYK